MCKLRQAEEEQEGLLRKIKVADLFCGAGGSLTGAKKAFALLGREMDLVCVNHWDRACFPRRAPTATTLPRRGRSSVWPRAGSTS